MKLIFMAIAVIGIAVFSINYAYSQEIGLATFQEMAQVIVDKSISQNVTASITLQSTSIQEIKIPAELEQKIRENDKRTAITKKSTRVADRAFPELKVTWRQPGDFGR